MPPGGAADPVPAPRGRRWLTIVALWTAFGAFYTAQSYTYRVSIGQSTGLWRLLPREILYIVLWAALTPLILHLSVRFRIDRTNWKTRAALHLGIALAMAFAQRAVHQSAIVAFGSAAFDPRSFLQTVLATFDYGVFLYFIVLLVSHAVDFHDRYRREQLQATRLKADLAAAKLETLQAQLQPHFLFNTLNSISTLVSSDPGVARRVIARLSDFLRATLENRESRSVTVRREMELLETYLDIERTRLGDRLSVDILVDREAERGAVPPLLLQPLVENAIRHGIAPRVGPGHVRIEIRRDGSWVQIVVQNRSAAGEEETAVESERNGIGGLGLGIANTRERLARLYPGRSSMEARAEPEGSFTVRVRLPYEEPES